MFSEQTKMSPRSVLISSGTSLCDTETYSSTIAAREMQEAKDALSVGRAEERICVMKVVAGVVTGWR